MKYKVIIFDLDGVLIKSLDVDTSYLFKIFPTMTMSNYQEIIRGNFYEGIKKFQLTNPKIIESDEERKARRMAHTEARLGIPLVSGMKEMLEKLYSIGCKLTINSSALEVNCTSILEKQNIRGLFDFLGVGELAESKVEKFKIIKEKYGVEDEEMIFITDTLGDLYEAKIANVPTIAVTWGAHNRSHFEQEAHDNLIAIVDSVEELSMLLLV